MAEKKFGSSRFLVLGAVYWLAVAALIGIAHRLWPGLAESAPFIVSVVLGVSIAGFVIVYIFRPKS